MHPQRAAAVSPLPGRRQARPSARGRMRERGRPGGLLNALHPVAEDEHARGEAREGPRKDPGTVREKRSASEQLSVAESEVISDT